MARWCHPKCRLRKLMGWLQMLLGGLVIIFSICTLFKFYSAGFFFHNEDICRQFTGVKDAYEDFDVKALSDRGGEVLNKLESLQEKLKSAVQQIEKDKEALHTTNITKFEYKKYLEEEVIRPLYTAHISLRLIRLPKAEGIHNSTMKEEPLINTFVIEMEKEKLKWVTNSSVTVDIRISDVLVIKLGEMRIGL